MHPLSPKFHNKQAILPLSKDIKGPLIQFKLILFKKKRFKCVFQLPVLIPFEDEMKPFTIPTICNPNNNSQEPKKYYG